MSAFLPTRASPRPSPRIRQKSRLPNLSSMDITTTSATSSISAALAGLSPKDVELIDKIIERSPPSATTFLTVFKAYNEVLQERGMDAANDVVYYKILLKLGVVKGMDWGTKWRMVKEQQGYGNTNLDADEGDATSESSRVPAPAPRQARGGIQVSRAQPRDILAPLHRHRMEAPRRPLSVYARDAVTVHSHRDESSEVTETETGVDTETGQYDTDGQMTEDPYLSSSPTTLIPRERASDTKENALRLSTEPASFPPLPTVDQFLPVQAKKLKSLHGTSEFSSDILTRASSPPLAKNHTTRRPLQPIRHPNIPIPNLTAAKAPTKAPSHNDSFNEEDTWKKVRMIRDEKEADKFREVMLLERCWEVWKSNLRWLNTMVEKVDEERDKALVQEHLEKWCIRLRRKLNEYEEIGRRHEIYVLRVALMKWKTQTQTVQVSKWREDMRRRMTIIKKKRDERILENTWTKWRQAHQGEAAYLIYERGLVFRTLRRWKGGLAKLERLETAAIQFSQSLDDAQESRAWEFWKLRTDLQGMERVISARVDARLKQSALRTWRQNLAINRKADAFFDRILMKHFYQAWKRSLSKQRNMVRKADKYKGRQEGILLMAVFRMWTARERGLLMDRARKALLLNNAWINWKTRLSSIRSDEERAIEFRNRPSSALAGAALSRWQQILLAHQTLLSQAEQYDKDILMHRSLLFWRIQLRVKLKLAKHAKVARKYLLMRNAWNRWKEMVQERKREKLLRFLWQKTVQKHFERWRSICARQRYHKLALKQLQVVISTRILTGLLSKWTNRVIAVKLRELEAVDRRDHRTLTLCYDKWKRVTKQHADELRLMQSYQYVKREELLRRMFHKWYSATKNNCHRRLVLQEREEEMKFTLLEKAWDRWREKYKVEQLAPLETKFAIQCQKSRLYQAYLIWHSKTRSIPAIRFYSSRTKAKFWRIWCEGMPKALQAREARKRDAQKVLSRALDKWTQAYRTKIALKAVAHRRARYLRLPSGAPRQSVPLSFTLRNIPRSTPSITSGKATRPASPSIDVQSERAVSVRDDVEDSASRAGSTGVPRRRLSALRATKLSIARPTYESGDAPNETRTDLWHELRRVQKKKPLSHRG
ncbi:hypothetical protein ACEPAG_5017 [Sanghuangporus baumii]